MRFILTLSALIVLAFSLSACNTVQGMGEDISAAGHGIAHAAK
jgi:predicted small secreted protein